MFRTGLILAFLALASAGAEETRDEKVLSDRAVVGEDGYWIYDDLPKAREAAATSRKPLLVVLRCIP